MPSSTGQRRSASCSGRAVHGSSRSSRRRPSSRSCHRSSRRWAFSSTSPWRRFGASVAATGISAVQLHGDESPSFAAALGVPVIRSITLNVADDARRVWPSDTTFLLDAADEVRRGGTGRTVDWARARHVADQQRVILAGGLTPENVAAAVAAGAPIRRRCVVGRRGASRRQGSRQGDALSCERAPRVDHQPSERSGTAMTVVVSSERSTFGRRDPDARGYFGAFGGRFVPETLVAPIEALTAGYLAARADPAFRGELDHLLAHYVGRPTPLYEATRLAAAVQGGAEGPHVPQA